MTTKVLSKRMTEATEILPLGQSDARAVKMNDSSYTNLPTMLADLLQMMWMRMTTFMTKLLILVDKLHIGMNITLWSISADSTVLQENLCFLTEQNPLSGHR